MTAFGFAGVGAAAYPRARVLRVNCPEADEQDKEYDMQVLIADDHKLVREAISAHMETSGGFEVSQAENVSDALEMIANSGGYDLVLLDLMMPGMNGLVGLREVLKANKKGRTAIFSGTARHQNIAEAIAMGASGFIPKTLSVAALVSAVHLIGSGEVFLPANFNSDLGQEAVGRDILQALKPLERSVLLALSGGATNKEIARCHDITEVAVKMHVRAICAKLGAKNRTQAAVIAYENGLT
ncbi:response regulator transcription factor [Thalassovita sp.]|uniref:response regulator transcription factor n=1 Tax=Thalassovita sp. TaxID=1979401 RepID=UPI0029DE8C22|nr:response regulator transcription factor [Thalassovita sp.]